MKPINNVKPVDEAEFNNMLEFSAKFRGRNFDSKRYKQINDLNYAETYKVKNKSNNSDNPYFSNVSKYSTKYGMDSSFIDKVMRQENSSFNPYATSNANAKGLMQLTDDTFMFVKSKLEKEGVVLSSVFNPDDNVHAGIYYLSYLKKKYGDDNLALAAYNAGPGNLNKWITKYKSRDWNVISNGLANDNMFKETRNYVNKINSHEQ